MLLKTLKAGARSLKSKLGRLPDRAELPYELERKIERLHARAPVERHLDILLGSERFGAEPYPALYRRCLADTGTGVTPFNVFQRFIGRLHLVRYFLATLDLEGLRAEVGVYRGASALLLCRATRSMRPDFDGSGLFLVDSFRGAGEAAEEDLIAVRGDDGALRREPFFRPGGSAVDLAQVRAAFSEFPRVELVPGWVPQVLGSLPAEPWAFVHLDVNLYQPTLAALEFFWPRLAAGGVIVSDDYGSPFTPGAKRAWEEFAERHGLGFIVLGERQSVLMKD
jgi:hypothetical protein